MATTTSRKVMEASHRVSHGIVVGKIGPPWGKAG